MIRFSESVSPCHPDKVADAISEYLLDRYLEKDPKTRYAVEVQIKDNHVTLGGEVSSKVHFNKKKIGMFVREAVNKLGYTEDYQIEWGRENTICGDGLNVTAYIGQQSPEIAQGVDNDGWGDQGIFFGMAAYGDDPKFGMMPKDFAIARWLNRELFHSGLGGLDIKTQVVMDDGEIRRVICAIPLREAQDKAMVEDFIHSKIKGDYTLIVNGTGAYVRHSSIADSGTTGRKLAVDFYGSGCNIGGGCVSGDTEYLSPNGWRRISDYKGGKVAQIDEDFNVTFVEPERYIDTFSDEVYKIGKEKSLQMVLSSNHNVFYKTSKGNYHKVPLASILEMQKTSSQGVHHEIPLFFRYEFDNGVKRYDEWMARLIVAHCADGTVLNQKNWNGRIRVKKQYKIERMRRILDHVNILHEERDYHDGFKYFYYKLDDTSKLLCEQFAGCDKDTAAIIASEVFWWDGDRKTRTYRTTHREDADFVQFIEMALSGDAYSVVENKTESETRKSSLYVVYKVKRHFSSPFRKDETVVDPVQKLEPQKVYCFTVPTGMLILRYHNVVFVTGNSPWTKDGSKADVALNLFARKLAKQAAVKYKVTCYTSLACCIGQEDVDYTITKAGGSIINEGTMRLPQSKLVHDLGLDKPIFESLCDYGLFGEFQADKAWEKVED